MSDPSAFIEAVPEAPPAAAPTGLGRFPRARRWGGILAVFFSAQSTVQLLGIGAGLLFVNFLPIEEFALYTLANSVLSFFTFASDLGSSSSLVYFYRATANEPGGFDEMLAAVRSLRRGAFLLGAVVTSIALPLVASRRGLPRGAAILCTAGVLVAVWFQIESSLGVLTLRLRNQYGRSYRAELAGGAVRLLLAATVVGFGLRLAWFAVLTGTAATALVAFLTHTGHPAAMSNLAQQRTRVLRYLTPSLPSALYFSIQGPLIIWLSATFGSTKTIAEVGAIGRLGLLVGVFGGLTGVVFLPYLARIHDERVYLRRFLQFGALLAALGGALFTAAVLAPRLFLAILGPHYQGLHGELLLVVGSAWLALISGYLVAVNLSRAWNRWESISVCVFVVFQVIFIALVDMSTAGGVLTFGLCSAIASTALQAAISTLGFRKPEWMTWKV